MLSPPHILSLSSTIMAVITSTESSDYDSSSSSITIPDSNSPMSHLSFSSHRRSSVSSSTASEASSSQAAKPHKANQAAWEAMKRLRSSSKGRVGLDHFHLLRRVGSGDIGNVYLCQIRSPATSSAGLQHRSTVASSQCFYAMKVVDREALAIRNKLHRAEMEKEILDMLDHPFLPTLYADFDASHYSCLVMEFCPGGDLYAARQHLPGKRFSLSSARFYAAETLLALEYLHMMGIVYRDLKPENVLVREDGHIMLSDFDLSLKCDVVPMLMRRRRKPDVMESNSDKTRKSSSSMPSCALSPMQPVLSCIFSSKKKRAANVTTITEHVDDDNDNNDDNQGVNYNQLDPELVAEPIHARSKSFVGTHEYLAPEVISGQGHGSAVDWWTFGIFLYEMLYGRTPFKGDNNEKTLINILKQPLSFPKIVLNDTNRVITNNNSNPNSSEMGIVQDLISKLLVKNPKKRIGSVKGSVEIKRHEFFKGVNWALIRSVRPPQVPATDHLEKIRTSISGNNRGHYLPKLSKKERDEPYQLPHHHIDYF